MIEDQGNKQQDGRLYTIERGIKITRYNLLGNNPLMVQMCITMMSINYLIHMCMYAHTQRQLQELKQRVYKKETRNLKGTKFPEFTYRF